MADKEPTKRNPEKIETGNLYFLYRPKVNEEEPSSANDVQRFHLVMSPTGKKIYRSLIIGRKELPPVKNKRHDQYWGFVDATKKDAKAMRDSLQEEQYETKTRGTQTRPAARPAGEGVYALYRENGSTRLAYVLELPADPGAPQKAFNIEPEANFVITIKNPDKPSPAQAGLQEAKEADYPKRLSEKFEDRRFIDCDPADFLDYEGTQFVLVSGHQDLTPEEEKAMRPQREDEEHADIFRDLRMQKTAQPNAPLFEGVWS